jgi:ribonuclease Y
MIILPIILTVVGTGAGFFVAYKVTQGVFATKRKSILDEATTEAELIKKERILQAKEKFQEMKISHEREITERNQRIVQQEQSIKQQREQVHKKDSELSRRTAEVETLRKSLSSQIETAHARAEELDKARNQHIEKLQTIAGMSANDAKNVLVENIKAEAQMQAMSYINEVVDEAKMTATKEARRIVVMTLQRIAAETSVDTAVTVFRIENDELKGRIIGREGRNIRALEAATGVEILVDDTPETITISCFDPVRREVARLAIHNLITDGRIHPARIEEVVAKMQKQVEDEIVDTGKRTCIDFGLLKVHPQLERLIGSMRYRSSYGQNLLQHSREVANLSAVMAAEVGLGDKAVKLAKRAGILHDIGKVSIEDPDLPHALLGMRLAEKYNECPEVCNAIGTHHEEIEMTASISPIVQICDAISGARPGVRHEIVDSYVKRIKGLENLALSFPGVIKAYAIQAGRELRVIVASEKVSDGESEKISAEIAKRIQDEMTYPGQVRITVIREVRAVSVAK